VAVTPDELGAAWVNGRVALPLRVERNGQPFGQPNGREMAFGFPDLIRYASFGERFDAGPRAHSERPPRDTGYRTPVVLQAIRPIFWRST
jgi:hypothetical protein